jgi:hypothetical protein
MHALQEGVKHALSLGNFGPFHAKQNPGMLSKLTDLEAHRAQGHVCILELEMGLICWLSHVKQWKATTVTAPDCRLGRMALFGRYGCSEDVLILTDRTRVYRFASVEPRSRSRHTPSTTDSLACGWILGSIATGSRSSSVRRFILGPIHKAEAMGRLLSSK